MSYKENLVNGVKDIVEKSPTEKVMEAREGFMEVLKKADMIVNDENVPEPIRTKVANTILLIASLTALIGNKAMAGDLTPPFPMMKDESKETKMTEQEKTNMAMAFTGVLEPLAEIMGNMATGVKIGRMSRERAETAYMVAKGVSKGIAMLTDNALFAIMNGPTEVIVYEHKGFSTQLGGRDEMQEFIAD